MNQSSSSNSPSLVLSHLSSNLKNKRKSMKLTQEAFAQLCGLHRTYIGAIERAERNITLSTLESIAQAIECSPYELIKPNARRSTKAKTKPTKSKFKKTIKQKKVKEENKTPSKKTALKKRKRKN